MDMVQERRTVELLTDCESSLINLAAASSLMCCGNSGEHITTDEVHLMTQSGALPMCIQGKVS